MKLGKILSFAAAVAGFKTESPDAPKETPSKHPFAKSFQDATGIPMIVIGAGGLRPSVKPVFSVSADQLSAPLPEGGLKCEIGFHKRPALITDEGLKYTDVNRTLGRYTQWELVK